MASDDYNEIMRRKAAERARLRAEAAERSRQYEARLAEEREALNAEDDDMAALREMFGGGIDRVLNDPVKFHIDPAVATSLAKAAGKGQTGKVKRISNRHKKELKAAASEAKGGCALILIAAVPAVATVVAAVVHYL